MLLKRFLWWNCSWDLCRSSCEPLSAFLLWLIYKKNSMMCGVSQCAQWRKIFVGFAVKAQQAVAGEISATHTASWWINRSTTSCDPRNTAIATRSTCIVIYNKGSLQLWNAHSQIQKAFHSSKRTVVYTWYAPRVELQSPIARALITAHASQLAIINIEAAIPAHCLCWTQRIRIQSDM